MKIANLTNLKFINADEPAYSPRFGEAGRQAGIENVF